MHRNEVAHLYFDGCCQASLPNPEAEDGITFIRTMYHLSGAMILSLSRPESDRSCDTGLGIERNSPTVTPGWTDSEEAEHSGPFL
jgi:hypothetical protein